MNRFLAKKKVKDDVAGSRPSIESESSSPFRMFGKNSKRTPDEEPKPQLDFSNALPSSDDFRTSLLLPGLSARFSMLRELDDPNTKVGKASDDSVLFPNTQSKLSGFHHDGRTESSDAGSLQGSLLNDLDSSASEDLASGTGSMINRGKATDGNNLFGGRQKVFRVPANGKHGGMSGRALYDDDVALSGFQKWRQAEKVKQTEGETVAQITDASSPVTSQQQAQQQVPGSRRGTESIISSPPPVLGRNSAASPPPFLAQRQMSVMEPQSTPSTPNASAVERSVTKTRRLYEQGLNRDLAEQQSSTFSRMNSLTKVRAFGTLTPEAQTTPPTSTSKEFGDRRQVSSKASAPNLRSFNPNGSAGANPPLSPPISESESRSSLQRKESDSSSAKAQRSIPLDLQSTSFFDDSDAGSVINQTICPSPTPQLSVERPDDDDHPAFRKSGPPTPGSLPKAPEDSPTLGPTRGLSSMVRAHLRSESTASSLFENTREAGDDQNGPSTSSAKQSAPGSPPRFADEEADKEQDEFARHLADGARRVRAKLTTYVDADPDRATPLPSSPVETPKELNPPRPTLGLLRSKSSRSSLFDRENRDHHAPRSLKTAMSTSNISTVLPSPRRTPVETEETRGRSTPTVDEEEDNIPVGLKAFRQARRELQKVKELEGGQQKYPSGAVRPLALRTISYEPSAPSPTPSSYSRMPTRAESRNEMTSRSGSQAPSERDRSGSDTSNGGRSSRMRNGSVAQDDRIPESPSGNARRMPPMSSGSNCRSRNGSKSSTPPMATSAAHFPAPIVAPPLPPLNPRRKNGVRGEDDSPLTSPRMPGGFPHGDDNSDEEYEAERRQRLRRATSEGNSLHGRARASPPRNDVLPPLPQGGYHHSGTLPGGMI